VLNYSHAYVSGFTLVPFILVSGFRFVFVSIGLCFLCNLFYVAALIAFCFLLFSSLEIGWEERLYNDLFRVE